MSTALLTANPLAPYADHEEVFAQHPEHRHLWVSNHGNVFSEKSQRFIGRVNRRGSEGRGREGRTLRDADEQNYRRVNVLRNGKRADVYVHILVLETFVGPRPSPLHEGDHIDRDLTNNHAYNLRWLLKRLNHPGNRPD